MFPAVAEGKPQNSPGAKAAIDPFKSLFNGRDLTGWTAFKNGSTERWRAANGSLTANESNGPGDHILTEAEFSHFDLRLDYRWLGAAGDAGVVLFISDANPNGVEVQITDDAANFKGFRSILGSPKFRHGAILGLQAPFRNVARPLGEWNSLKILSRDSRLTVEENGQLINEFDFGPLKPKFRERFPNAVVGTGHIALQCKAGGIEYRNIKIKE